MQPEDLTKSDIHVRVDTIKSGVTANSSQPGPPTVICQGAVVVTLCGSTTVAGSEVPAHAAIVEEKKPKAAVNLRTRFIAGYWSCSYW
jgi:hypothetical protein